jgi:hypothetical protein
MEASLHEDGQAKEPRQARCRADYKMPLPKKNQTIAAKGNWG